MRRVGLLAVCLLALFGLVALSQHDFGPPEPTPTVPHGPLDAQVMRDIVETVYGKAPAEAPDPTPPWGLKGHYPPGVPKPKPPQWDHRLAAFFGHNRAPPPQAHLPATLALGTPFGDPNALPYPELDLDGEREALFEHEEFFVEGWNYESSYEGHIVIPQHSPPCVIDLDDQYLGQTPVDAGVSAGVHVIEMHCPVGEPYGPFMEYDYQTFTGFVDVQKGSKVRIGNDHFLHRPS